MCHRRQLQPAAFNSSAGHPCKRGDVIGHVTESTHVTAATSSTEAGELLLIASHAVFVQTFSAEFVFKLTRIIAFNFFMDDT